MKDFVSRLSVLAVVLFASAPLATAQKAGYDVFRTTEGTYADLTEFGLGKVDLKGVPITKSLGDSDTIIRRAWEVSDKEGATPIYVYALFMKSTKSVTFKGQEVDVYITINNSGGAISKRVLPQPDVLTPSLGILNVRKESDQGGKFSSKLEVNADVILVKAGTRPTIPGNVLVHQAAPAVTMTATDIAWSAAPPEGLLVNKAFPTGGFHPAAIRASPAHSHGIVLD